MQFVSKASKNSMKPISKVSKNSMKPVSKDSTQFYNFIVTNRINEKDQYFLRAIFIQRRYTKERKGTTNEKIKKWQTMDNENAKIKKGEGVN